MDVATMDRGEKRLHREGCGGRERERLARKVERKRRHSWLGDSHMWRRVDVEERERERVRRGGGGRRRRWKEEAARPNMAAILCIPVVDGEVGKQARPQR